MTPPVHDASRLFVEIGAAIVLLAILARLASRWGFSAIPLYLLAGLAFGNGGGWLRFRLARASLELSTDLASCCCYSCWDSNTAVRT